MDDVWLVLLQLLLVGTILGTLLTYLLRGLMCRATVEVGTKSVLITGCDTGIGNELAKYLDGLGFHVFAGCLDTSSEGAQRLRVECSPFLKLVNMDVTRDDHVQHAVQYVRDNLPAGEQGLYALINNAGICVCGEFEWQTWRQVENQINVNVLGTLRVTKAFLQLLKSSDHGRIVNVSSVAGLYGYPGLSTYCATKHAIEAVSSVLRHELVKFDISVVTVQPGDFSKATHLLDNHHRNMNEMWSEMSDGQREEYKEYFIAYHNGVAKTGITGKRIKPITVLPENVINGFEKAMLTKVPNDHYLLLPTWHSQLKMTILGYLPQVLAQKWAAKKYRKALPKVVPQSPTLHYRNLSHHGSFRSTSSSTMSSVMSSTSF